MSQALPRILAGVAVVLVAGYFLISSRSKQGSGSSVPASASPASATPAPGFSGNPDDRVEAAKAAVHAMLDAAQKGNVQEYVRRFAGEQGRQVRALVSERGEKAFGEGLRRTNAEIKGIVLHGPEPLSRSWIRMKCELLFIDHNEMQELTLEDSRSGWRIIGLKPMGSFQMVRPYGSLAYPVLQTPPGAEQTPAQTP